MAQRNSNDQLRTLEEPWPWEKIWQCLPAGWQDALRLLVGTVALILQKQTWGAFAAGFLKESGSNEIQPFTKEILWEFTRSERAEYDAWAWMASLIMLLHKDKSEEDPDVLRRLQRLLEAGLNQDTSASQLFADIVSLLASVVPPPKPEFVLNQQENVIEAIKEAKKNGEQAIGRAVLFASNFRCLARAVTTHRPDWWSPNDLIPPQRDRVHPFCVLLQWLKGTSPDTFPDGLWYALLFYYLMGWQEEINKGADIKQVEEIPIPVLYYPDVTGTEEEEKEEKGFRDFIRSFDEFLFAVSREGGSTGRGDESFTASTLWNQFNAIMWIPRQEYPWIHQSSSGNSGSKHRSAYDMLNRERFFEWLWQVWHTGRVQEHTSQEDKRKSGIADLYTLLANLERQSERVAQVGVEHHIHLYPGVRLQVGRIGLPFEKHDPHWEIWETPLGEENWGLVGEMCAFFYSERGPTTHLVLLVGPYGVGKTSVAQALSLALVNVEPPDWYILAPQPENQALEFLPVNNYNVFYLFRRAELSRIPLEERLAQLRYYPPPHKNYLINFAELNASSPEQIRERLRDMEAILRELREKAIPKRVLVFMALNYAGLFGEFPRFLDSRPDLIMGGARLSHLWIIQPTEQCWESSSLPLGKPPERDTTDEMKKLKQLVDSFESKQDDTDPQRAFLEHYLQRRLFGRGYLTHTRYHPANSWLISSMIGNLLSKPGRRTKATDPDHRFALPSLRPHFWAAKASLYERAYQNIEAPLPQPFQEILSRYRPQELEGEEEQEEGKKKKGKKNEKLKNEKEKFLEAWGVRSALLATYLGTDPLVRLAMRQGFIRTLNTYLLRELQLQLAEREAAERLSETVGAYPVAKYREILALTRILSGLLSVQKGNIHWAIVQAEEEKEGKQQQQQEQGQNQKEYRIEPILTLLNFNSERVRVPLSPAEEPRWRVKHAGCGPVTR